MQYTGDSLYLNQQKMDIADSFKYLGDELTSKGDYSVLSDKCTFQILGVCQGRRTGVEVTTVSNSLILGGWVTKV